MKIPIVDDEDNIIYHVERSEKKDEEVCRTAGLWVTDTEGNILLAQRSFNKKYYPGMWGPAAAGVIEEGETYKDGIMRETKEEIGLININPTIGEKIKFPDCFSQQFFLTIPVGFNDFVIQEEEVKQVKWFSREDLKKEINNNPDIFIKFISELI